MLQRGGLLVILVGIMVLVGQSHAVHAQGTSKIAIDANTHYQTIDGFGTAEVAPWTNTLYTMSSTQQQQVLDLLFNPTNGAGLSMYRFEIGAGLTYDNIPDFTIEPNSPGSPGANPGYMWDHSADHQVWLAQQAQQRGVSTIYGDAWSAPAFMKDNTNVYNLGSLCGEVSCSSGDWRQAYANYLTQYVKDYQSEGVNLTQIGFDNEPGQGSSYQSMSWTSAQLTDFVKVLGSTLSNANVATRVACCDEAGYDNNGSALNTVLADPTAASDLGVATVHGYGTNGVVSPVTSATNAGKHTWQSEYTCVFDSWNMLYSSGDCNGQSWSDHIYQTLSNGVNAYFDWIGAGNTHTDNEDLIHLTGSSSYQVSSRLWVMGNYSRYVRPGATRIGASSGDGNMLVTAFKNTDGSYALVVDNHESSPVPTTINIPALASGTATPYVTSDSSGMAQQSSLAISNGSLNVTMPPNATITFKLTSASSGGTLSNGTYVIQNNTTGECLSLRGNNAADGTLANVWHSINASSQYWTLTGIGNGQYTIQSGSTGEYLAIQNDSGSDGALADVWHWVNAPSQTWTIGSAGNGLYTIQNNNGEYLSIQGNSASDDAQVNQWHWLNASSQYWSLFPQT
jgi:O-glycosyl hydrolase